VHPAQTRNFVLVYVALVPLRKIAKRRGLKRPKGALAGKLAVVLHRMWIDETDFHFSAPAAPAQGSTL